MSAPEFHECVCRKVPSTNLRILKSTLSGPLYSLRREHNLDVNIPDIARKFLKDAFKLWRDDDWDFDGLTCHTRFKMNMPAEFSCATRIAEADGSVIVIQAWEVKVNVPLIHGILARHAEAEIRRFNAIEIAVIEQEVMSRLEGIST